jgi:hypothetical protein
MTDLFSKAPSLTFVCSQCSANALRKECCWGHERGGLGNVIDEKTLCLEGDKSRIPTPYCRRRRLDIFSFKYMTRNRIPPASPSLKYDTTSGHQSEAVCPKCASLPSNQFISKHRLPCVKATATAPTPHASSQPATAISRSNFAHSMQQGQVLHVRLQSFHFSNFYRPSLVPALPRWLSTAFTPPKAQADLRTIQ